MRKPEKHTGLSSIDSKSKAFFKNGRFDWDKSEADVWAEMEEKIGATAPGRHVKINMRAISYSLAAIFLLLIGTGFFFRYYSKTVSTPSGEHFEVVLPCGSAVNLNAESELTYYPLWWKIERKMKFEGEGLFNVETGKSFTVSSKLGTTNVLGTSFNIYARKDVYEVTCIAGKVKVSTPAKKESVLLPNSKAIVTYKGEIKTIQQVETMNEISWKDHLFLFTATPAHVVFEEIERQYGVNIDLQANPNLSYTGNFSKDQNVEEILTYICPALGLEFSRKTPGTYVIISGSE
ncbi:MAG: FecR family protein [Prolixibacteraceae bacterium]|nr:FecR family protein [Prolixibacteraceae bacterium]